MIGKNNIDAERIRFKNILRNPNTKYFCNFSSLLVPIISIKIKKSAYGNDLFLCIIYLEYMRI